MKNHSTIKRHYYKRGWCSHQLVTPHYLGKHPRTTGGVYTWYRVYNSVIRESLQRPVARDRNVLFHARFYDQESTK